MGWGWKFRSKTDFLSRFERYAKKIHAENRDFDSYEIRNRSLKCYKIREFRMFWFERTRNRTVFKTQADPAAYIIVKSNSLLRIFWLFSE